MKLKWKVLIQMMILGLAYNSCCSLPFIQYILYDPFQEALKCTNTQMGLLLTIYGLGNIFGAPIGGYLVDKFGYKKIYLGSLALNAIFCVAFATHITYITAIFTWIGLAITSLLMIYPAHLKIIRLLADEKSQGKIYGINESFVGLGSIIINAVILAVFSRVTNAAFGMNTVIYVIAAFNVIGVITVYFIMKNLDSSIVKTEEDENVTENGKMTFKEFLHVVKSPETWLVGLSIFSVYSLSVTVSYFTPFFTAVLGSTVVMTGAVSIIRTYVLRLVGSPIGGEIADKMKSSLKFLTIVYGLGILTMVILMTTIKNMTPVFFIALTLFIGLVMYMGRGCYYAVSSELKVPRKYAASTIGVAAALGFSPDIFMFVLAGHWIDTYGTKGYNYLFIFQIVILVIGLIGNIFALRYKKKAIEREA